MYRTYGELIFDKGNSVEKEGNYKWCWDNWTSIQNFDPYFVSYMKINSKWTVNPRATKLLEEDTEEIFFDLGLGQDFLDTARKAIYIKRK